jgi:DNA-directed RNA polymerase beta' subunit
MNVHDQMEMNLHVPQSLQTHHEIMSLAAVPLHIISPRHAKPIVTIVQDVALGVYRITQGDVRVTHRQLMNLMASNPEFRDLEAPAGLDGVGGSVGRWTGRQVLSTIIPRGTYVSLKNKDAEDRGCPAEDYSVVIRDGALVSGVLSTKEYKEASRGLVHSIYNDKGPLALTTFLNNTQKLICDWLVLSGFSVGISDLATPMEVERKLRDKVRDMKVAVYQKVHEIQTGKFENASTKNNDEFFESQVTTLLNKGHKDMQNIGISCFDARSNRMLNMIRGGSKGGPVNFTQMVACVGQQTIDSGRVPDGFENRTLPHYTKFDDGPEARGFVEHSFIHGLTPQEFFFHSMGGRIGLIDTAVKSVTGDTPIVVIEGGQSKRVLIGDWIDAKLDAEGAKARTKVYGPEDRNMELLELAEVQDGHQGRVYIPTMDDHGHVTWGELTAVTRHDPGERLYKVTTHSGREVTVAESKSLLVWQAESKTFEATDSPNVKVGDYLPVTANLPEPPIVAEYVDMSAFFPKGEYIWGSEMHKAAAAIQAAQGSSFHIPRGFWERSNGVDFVPYPSKARFQRAFFSGRSGTDNIKEGYIYPFHATRQHSLFPDRCDDDNVGDSVGVCDDDVRVCDDDVRVCDDVYDENALDSNLAKTYNEEPAYSECTAIGDCTSCSNSRFSSTSNSTSCSNSRFGSRCRSNDDIKHNKQQQHASFPLFPDRLPLDFENGVFIGLYLADGHTCAKSGIVGITKNDPVVRAWVARWFEKWNMTHHTQDNSNERGTSITIQGHSTLWAIFLDQFVGHGSRNKHIPDVAYTAPLEFVRGLLSGYISGDGTIDALSLNSNSVSFRLSEGIAHLFMRLGAFSKWSVQQTLENNLGDGGDGRFAPNHSVAIRSKWAQHVASKLELIYPLKARKLAEMQPSNEYRRYNPVGDVVLDPIRNIEVLGSEAHPKLYDVTVPSTLNFIVANGLGARDTSETGYIQRKLVKAMEDAKINYDLSVRNAAGHIVQFRYGDDGMDPIKLEYQHLTTVHAEPWRILEVHYIADAEKELSLFVRTEVLANLVERKEELRARMDAFHAKLLGDKRYLVRNVHGREQNDLIVFPVHMARILDNVSSQMGRYGCNVASDLNPLDVLDTIDQLSRELSGQQGVSAAPDYDDGKFMPMLLRCFLSPKPLLLHYRFDTLAFDRAVQLIRSTYYKALAQPGEMVGIVAAQSIGEPTTQMSVIGSTNVYVRQPHNKESVFYGPIQELVDGLIAKYDSKCVRFGPRDENLVLDLPEGEEHYVPGVADNEKTSWRRISQVSRHPANGGLVRLFTKSGKSTCATLSHSFLKRVEAGVAPVLGSELKVGDRVPVAKSIPIAQDPLQRITIGGRQYALTREFGWFCGAYIADGCINGSRIEISKIIPEYQDMLRTVGDQMFGTTMEIVDVNATRNAAFFNGRDMRQYATITNLFRHADLANFLMLNFNTGSYNKRIPGWVYASNGDFIKGLLSGYFDGDGCTEGTNPAKQMIRAGSVSETLTEDIIVLLAFTGIFASKCKEKAKTARSGTLFTVQIPRKYSRRFKEEIGLVVNHKAAALDNIIEYEERDDKHSSKEEIDMIPELGDVLAFVGKALELPGQSRLYARYQKKDAIGRETLKSYIDVFENSLAEQRVSVQARFNDVVAAIDELATYLQEAAPDANARGVIPLPQNIGDALATTGKSLFPSGGFSQYHKLKVIGCATLNRFIDELGPANEARLARDKERLDTVPPKIAILRQAAYSDVVWDEIVSLEILPDPQEYVYDFTVPSNDSFMVDCGVLVHNTLNSVHYDTELLVRKDGRELQRVTIGDFVEGYLAALQGGGDKIGGESIKKRLESHPNDTWLGWLKEPPADPSVSSPEGTTKSAYEILSCDEDGKVTWREVEAVTKHPVVNKDGSDTLLKVTTRSGRDVIATKAKSFLMRRENKIVQVEGEDIKVGDYLPVSRILPVGDTDDTTIKVWDLSKHLPKTEFTYASEVEKALAFSKTKRTWFQGHNGVDFTVPYSRSDTFLVSTRLNNYKPGCVYPKKQTGTTSEIPEAIPLDADFGFFVGAYLAEGCCCSSDGRPSTDKYQHHCLISNIDGAYQSRIKDLCAKWGCSWHMDERTDERGKTATVRIHSVILASLMTRACGNGAAKKRFPAELLAGPLEFLIGVLDGYFSGDGYVDKSRGCLSATSVSKGLLQDVQQILTRFDISSNLRSQGVPVKDHYLQGYILYVNTGNVARFNKLVHLTVEYKQERLDNGQRVQREFTYGRHDIIPDVMLSMGTITVHRDKVAALLRSTTNADDRKVLEQIMDENIVYDEIVSIEEVPNEGRTHVYDLTVEGTRNFNIFNGLAQKDTFHLSGVANKGMQGVPRLKELMSVSKNIKTPCMEIHLRRPYSQSLEAAKAIVSEIQTTRFKDLVLRSRIYYDPDDDATMISDDAELMGFYRQFRELDDGSNCDRRTTPWVLRFEFDRAKMLELQVTMLDLEHVLSDWYDDRVTCSFSDDNAKTLLCRLRIVLQDDENMQDMLTDLKALEQSILEKVVIKGITSIHRAAVEPQKSALLFYDDATDAFTQREEIRISTNGSNLIKVLAHDSVDPYNTVTNDVQEIYGILGIEAARACLFNEMQSVMCIDDKNNVNYRHMALLVDVMTNRGVLQSIDRHGINRGEIGPLAKCSFEETTDMLVKAGIFAELDRINGVSANIMLGQVAPCGTGDCEVLLDDAKLEALGKEVDIEDIMAKAAMQVPGHRARVQQQQHQHQQQPHQHAQPQPDFVAPEADSRIQEKKEAEIEFV